MTVAARALTLTAALGVKVFLEAQAGSGNAYAALPFATIDADLQYLGLHRIREGAYDARTADPALVQAFAQLVQQGFKFDFGAGNSAADLASVKADIDQFVVAHPGALEYVEGPNEINYYPFSYLGQSGQAAAILYQQDVKTMISSDPLLAGVQVLDYTGGGQLLGPGEQSEPVSGIADLANVHLYPANGDPPLFYVNFVYYVQYGHSINAPYVVTEAGYNSDPATTNGVSEDVQAKQTLDLVLDAVQSGATAVYLYELLDHYADPGNTDPDNHWGLFNSDGSPKPVATAIHNLTAILSDGGTQAASFTPDAVGLTIQNLPWMGHSWLLEKSSGVFDLVLWAEPNLWNAATQTEIAAPTYSVSVDLGQAYRSVRLFDPLTGASAITDYGTAQTVSLGLSDHALILEFGSGASPAAAASSGQGGTAGPASGATSAAASVGVWRFFDTATGVHFYTTSAAEAQTIIRTRADLVPEGQGTSLVALSSTAGDPNAEPVYRFFDTRNGTHFYTASTTERDTLVGTRSDLIYEPGSNFFEHLAPQPGDVPVYRFFDTANGSHFYSDSASERATILATRPDLIAEGIGFYEPPRT